jgi:hypothetical protein
MQDMGITEAYFFQEGVILSPDDLAVGAHTLRVKASDGFDAQVTFHIDAAGTGVCV